MIARSHLLIALGFLTGAAAGWFAAQRTAEAPPPPSGGNAGSPPRPNRPRPSLDEERRKVAAAMAPIRAVGTRWEAIQAAVALAQRIPPEDIPRWLDAGLFKHPDGIVRATFLRTLRDRHFDLDPTACLTDMLARQHERTWEYARRWAKRDPRGALETADANPTLRSSLLAPALAALARTDPAAVLARLEEAPPGRDIYPADIFRALAETDPQRFIEHARSWHGSFGEDARNTALAHWVKEDISSCLSWLTAEQDGESMLMKALRSGNGPGKSIAANLHRIPTDWLARIGADSSLAHTLARGAGKEWLAADLEGAGISPADAARFRTWAVVDLARSDPQRALSEYLAVKGTDDDTYRSAAHELAQILADSDAEIPPQTLEALDEPLRGLLADAETSKASRSDEAARPLSTPDSLRKVAEGSLHPYQLATTSWSPQAVSEAIETIRTFSAEELQQFTRNGATESVFPYPLNAELLRLQLEGTGAAPNTDLIRQTASTASRWVSDDPSAASRWVTTLPEGEARHWAVLNLAAHWHRHDPDAATAWIDTLPTEADRSSAREGLDP